MPDLEDHLQEIIDTIDSTKMLEDLAIMLIDINAQINAIKEDAAANGLSAYELKNAADIYALAPLLSAKAHALNAIATLKSTEEFAKSITFNQYLNGVDNNGGNGLGRTA
jgi:hypothetical protein